MIVIDEAAYIKESLFHETIAPLLEVRFAALIAISTPLDEHNWFTKILNLKEEDGSSFFKVCHLYSVCDECLKLPSLEDMIKCEHGNRLPPWKSTERHKRNTMLTLAMDDVARGLREGSGVHASSLNSVFDKGLIRKNFDNPRMIRTVDSPPRLYIMADPDCGGKSYMSVISGYVLNEGYDRDCHTLVVSVSIF